MVVIPGKVEWVENFIPDLEMRKQPFVVATDEVDDELVEVFVAELRRLTDELRTGLERNDLEMVRMAAHSVKGMGGTIGLPEISVLGLEIETLAKKDRLPDSKPLVDALAHWITTIN